MQPGWTYLFEALYRDNRHVIPYHFEALLLLSAIDPSGHELPSAAALQQLARQLGVMAVPCVEGTSSELTDRLAQGCRVVRTLTASNSDNSSSKSSTGGASGGTRGSKISLAEFSNPGPASSSSCSSSGSAGSSQPAACEGWVLQDHAKGQRSKLVQYTFLKTGHAASQLLHPLAVWDAVYCGKSRAELMRGLPAHYQQEVDAVLTALEQQFWAVQQHIDRDLQCSWLLGTAALGAEGAKGAAAAAGVGGGEGGRGVDFTAAASPHASAAGQPVDNAPAGPEEDSTDSVSSSSGGAAASGSGMHAVPVAAVQAELSKAAAPHTQAYKEALQYAQLKATAYVPSMFMKTASSDSSTSYRSRSSSSSSDSYQPAPSLRGLLLSCIKPSTDGTLPGYTPSPAFQQTYCKGWAKGPQQGRVSVLAGEPLIHSMLDDQALMSVLGVLQERRDVGRVLLVCRGWSKLLQGDAGFKAKAQQHASSRSSRINMTTRSHSPDYAYYNERRAYRYGYNSDSSGYGSC
jgi:hypothetical protein